MDFEPGCLLTHYLEATILVEAPTQMQVRVLSAGGFAKSDGVVTVQSLQKLASMRLEKT